MKTFEVSAPLQPLLEQMSRDMAVPVEGLVNQAVFNWARLHGYLEPGGVRADVPAPTPTAEPETSQVPVVSEPDWREVVQQARRVFLVFDDREVLVEGERFLIGRDVSCNVSIDSPRISRQHAALAARPGGVTVEDLGSSNGTWFNGEQIKKRELLDGDELYFGDVLARVEFR